MLDVADGKHAGHAGLEGQWGSRQVPGKTELRRSEEVGTGDQVAPGSRWMEAGSQDVCGGGAQQRLREALEADARRRRRGVACAYRPLDERSPAQHLF
jgi:hypothetical protein